MPIFQQRDTANFIVQILQTFDFWKVSSKKRLTFCYSSSLQVEGYFLSDSTNFQIFEKFLKKLPYFYPFPVITSRWCFFDKINKLSFLWKFFQKTTSFFAFPVPYKWGVFFVSFYKLVNFWKFFWKMGGEKSVLIPDL